MNNLPPFYNPKIYTLSSMIIGYLLIDDLTANEQNALGNWFMTIGQILECNSAIQQTFEEGIKGDHININSHQFKSGGSPFIHKESIYRNNNSNSDELELLKKTIQKIKDKLDEL